MEYNTNYLIGGELVESTSDQSLETENPALGEVMETVPVANKTDVNSAVRAAKDQFKNNWKDVDPIERGETIKCIAEILRENEDYLIDVEIKNNGSSYQKMSGDISKGADRLDYFSGLVREIKGETTEVPGNTINYTLREPLGVVGAVIPFNHPLGFVASKIGPALAAGNSIVIKPSEQTPLSALAFAELIAEEEGVPDGLINIIAGDGKSGSHLTSHEDVNMITFVGSVETGKAVMKDSAENISPVLLELGGKNPSIIFPDADLSDTIPACVDAMSLKWQGQSCSSGTRVLVHKDIHDEVVDGIVDQFENISVGMPADESADMGAMVSQDHYENVLEYIKIGKNSDADLVTGGDTITIPESDGYFIEPTVFDNVDPDSRIAQEEIFGPVLSIITWSDYDEMVEIANGVKYGLTASIWTENLRTGLETANNLDAGYIWINRHGPKPQGTPYGGVKQSGIGRTNCLREVMEHTRTKNVNIQLDRSQWDWEL